MSNRRSSQKWVPLECNPEVFNSWAKQAGLILSQDCFHDVLGLDEELLALIPQPVKALILIFPDLGEVKARNDSEDESVKQIGAFPVDPTLVWIKQTINNACGTMAIVHALANSNVTFSPHSPLSEFIIQCQGKTPDERAHLLETTPLFTNIHTNTAQQGQSIVTDEVMDTPLHYSAFVTAPEPDLRKKASEGGVAAVALDSDSSVAESESTLKEAAEAMAGRPKDSSGMRLIELDGERVGPLDRGECKDVLRDAVRYIKENYIKFAPGDVRFNILALAPPSDGST
ncbi:hypothetical protein ONZ45_g377 [Pleurotus djamor]|nr:hypothetical protein ONZ45_g377 [Pleurotus djamor]